VNKIKIDEQSESILLQRAQAFKLADDKTSQVTTVTVRKQDVVTRCYTAMTQPTISQTYCRDTPDNKASEAAII